MSRVAKNPVAIPAGVEVKIDGQEVTVKGSKETLSWAVHKKVEIKQEENELVFSGRNNDKEAWALAGTTRALVNNMVVGVSTGFQKTLELNGVGYRAKAAGNVLSLTLGFSHPVEYELPEGVVADTPSQTQIVLKGASKQQIGQVAAEIRAFRPPEPYKGKGIRYSDEHVRRKEAKKK
ncbi:50S ribosomal protein L6 [marine gamma proteobacterium HTCC2143]|jgi:large subunit ribosomal protein L6|uniref:Large ribosomal subunit protein uL6 n=1 Tax=marine gamma proteobacterium HTCC2143 TaxID=247633 RepID=A0YGM4_9GAMM|nr:50S ribosomal protein L6 [marine gamma proteobacterium HTCC2143]